MTVARIDPDRAYVGVPELLQKVIDEADDESWRRICGKIDYIYANLDHLFGPLEEETDYGDRIREEVGKGKKVLFKPNLVIPESIDPFTHGETSFKGVCTEWTFVAALMRWIHDNLGVSYHEMALGETATLTSMFEGYYNLHFETERPVTTEALYEGRSGEFYGGWGFYFARRYLAETHPPGHDDDPMSGYEESVSGAYLPPGRAGDKLMVYDLNRVSDVKGKGRVVPVPDGVNFTEVTLHKAVVGGDPDDPEDLKDYPGCFLVNVPRLKLHSTDLLTNALKSLGLGLYPMEAAENDDLENPRWKYSFPLKRVPGMKTEVPHSIWELKQDEETNLPVKDEDGNYVPVRTGGMMASQADVIKATENQGVSMLHVSDVILATNLSHTGSGAKIPEGLIAASLDPVALDLACARYCYKMVPLEEARGLDEGAEFIQRVPVPRVEGGNIVTGVGFDSPLPRYELYSYCAERGLGREEYHVRGWDVTENAPIVSVRGHLGRLRGGEFQELMTSELYYNPGTLIWDLQNTVTAYLEANDTLTGSSFHRELFDIFDEDQDGVISYHEKGKVYCCRTRIMISGVGYHLWGVERYGFLKGPFLQSRIIAYGDERWNPWGHTFYRDYGRSYALALAYAMSRAEAEEEDPYYPGMSWGRGKWPSLQYVNHLSTVRGIYGSSRLSAVGLSSMYGRAFQYADKTLNDAGYTGDPGVRSAPDALERYLREVGDGEAPLDFVLYVPEGYGSLEGVEVPNVVETDDSSKIFTARFDNGRESWP